MVDRLNIFFHEDSELVVMLDLDGTIWDVGVANKKIHFRPHLVELINYLERLKKSGLNIKVGIWSYSDASMGGIYLLS